VLGRMDYANGASILHPFRNPYSPEYAKYWGEYASQIKQTTLPRGSDEEGTVTISPQRAKQAAYLASINLSQDPRPGAYKYALKKFPLVNASIDGNDIVYHGYFDIGIAVGSPRGLVVPILRNADQMSLADIEKKIAEFGQKAKDGKLSIEEMTGGTFSISNGGVFGSMLSTPIINPPQSAILGVHATKERAVVENGQIVIRPMNYLALSYDHRIIDGREAVLSLVAMKDALEDPARLLLDL